MEMRYAASLELQNPQIMDAGKTAAKSGQPCVQMFLDRAAIGNSAVIRQTELGDKGHPGVIRKEAETTPGLVAKSLNLGTLRWGGGSTMYVRRTYKNP